MFLTIMNRSSLGTTNAVLSNNCVYFLLIFVRDFYDSPEMYCMLEVG